MATQESRSLFAVQKKGIRASNRGLRIPCRLLVVNTVHFQGFAQTKLHNTLRCTPAMAADVERDFWTVGNLVEAVL
jgi:hypothetical protein